MRLTNEVKFYDQTERRYNPNTSQYEGGETLVATVMANVTDIGTNRSNELFGKLDANSKVVRMVEPVKFVWSYLTIDDDSTHYVLQTDRRPLKNATLIVGETNVQSKA